MNIFSTRRKTERIAVVDAYLSRLDDRIDVVESAVREPADLAPLRDRVALQAEVSRDHAERLGQMELSLGDLQGGAKDIVLAVADGIERTDRAERRIQATVKRARKELRDRGLIDPGLEAEDHELSADDGDRGDNGGLRALPKTVERPAPAASSVRGVTVEQLHRARGFQ